MMESLEKSARNITAHFHAFCRGKSPLHLNEEAYKFYKPDFMDDKAVNCMSRLKALVETRANELRQRATGPPGSQLVWISRILLPGEEL